jgi:hypothetical protein
MTRLPRAHENSVNNRTRELSRKALIINYLRTFNIFAPFSPTTDAFELRNELVSTRLFLLLCIFSTFVVAIYALQQNITETVHVPKPAFDQFRQLAQRYSTTLSCSCANIAVMQNTFISLYPDMHQVCSSDFVTSKWITHIYAAAGDYISTDLSYVGGPLFQALSTFCDLGKTNLNDSLVIFNNTRFISSTMLTEDLFFQRTQSIIDTFKGTTVKNFIQSFNIVRDITHSNYLMSGLFTNAEVHFTIDPLVGLRFKFYNNGSCNCFLTPRCVVTVTCREINGSEEVPIPGLYIGCYVVDAMRSSTLECMYNRTCLDQLESILQSPLRFNATILDSSRSKFAINSTIDTLLSNGMVEQWHQNISWSNYYEQCHPHSCTYSFRTKHNVVYMITIILSVVGGLFKILMFIVPLAVRLIRRRLFRVNLSSVEASNGRPEDIFLYHVHEIFPFLSE